MSAARNAVTATLAVLTVVWLAGVARADVVLLPLAPTQSRLVFIEGRDAARVLGEHRPPSVKADSPAEREILALCSNGEAQRATGTDKGFLTSLLSTALSATIDKAAERVRAEIARYSAVSESSQRIDYYRAELPGRSGRLDSRYTCLRYTRYGSDGADTSQVALDFIASVGLDTTSDAILLRPLRVFVGKATAKSAGGHYGIAIAVRAEAAWRDEATGHEAVVFDRQVALEQVDLGAGSFLKYYGADPLGGLRVPIVPISFGSDRTHDFGRCDFTVSAAEIGTVPATLTLLSQLLPVTTDRRTKLLVEAAGAAADGLLLP